MDTGPETDRSIRARQGLAWFGTPAGLTTYSAKLTEPQAAVLERLLREGPYVPRQTPHARCSAAAKDLNITLYESLKLVIQGKGTGEFVEFVLEPQVLGEARVGYEAVLDPTLLDPRVGVDEAGKGDFFGPLCIGGAYVNAAVLAAWRGQGVRDSKTVSTDARIGELARMIRETPGCVADLVAIGPAAYNRMWERSGSVNRVLAWGHARVIENLLDQPLRLRPPPVRAVSDQFSSSKSTVERALMEKGRQLELVQRHGAEEDQAVAAASILARDGYVAGLKAMEKQWGMPFPKGASAQVETAAREFVARHGAAALSQVAKTHFRTAARVLGLPEPPRVEWRKGRKESADPGVAD